jgi:hypothetical protein
MLSPEGIVEEFIELWKQSDLPKVMPMPDVAAVGPLVELGTIGVYDEHQGRGHMSSALRILTTLCDKNSVVIKLVPSRLTILPGCTPSLSTEQLIEVYGRKCFVETQAESDGTREMTREPQLPDWWHITRDCPPTAADANEGIVVARYAANPTLEESVPWKDVADHPEDYPQWHTWPLPPATGFNQTGGK